MPVTSFEVGTVLNAKDNMSKVIAKIGGEVKKLNDQIEWAQLNLNKLGIKNFAKLEMNLKKVQDQFVRFNDSIDAGILGMTSASNAAGASVRNLATQWQAVGAAASAAARATNAAAARSTIAGAAGGGAGGRGGRNAGGWSGLNIRGPGGTPLGGGFHAHSHELVGQGLLAALGIGIVQQSKLEDFAYRGVFTAGVTPSHMSDVENIIKRIASKTGGSIPDLGEATLDEIRQLGGTGLSWKQKMKVLGPLLTYGAAEGRLKGTSTKEGVDSIIGLAHMLKVYDPQKIAQLANKFAYLSTVNPAKLHQMERASGYAVPILGELGFDPFQVMMLQTAMMRGGILNTKSGTWLRQLGVRALPGTSTMSKEAFRKHESALSALGLIDSKNNPTWFTNGAPDLVKLLEMAGSRLQAMPIAQRAGIMQQLFGSQGSGAMAFLSDPKILKMLPDLQKDMNKFESGSALYKNYALNSPVQQFDQAWANLRNVLMDISTIVLPPLTGALQRFDDMLKELQKILPSSNGAFGKAVGKAYGAGIMTGNPIEALGAGAWGALKYWWTGGQKKDVEKGAKDGSEKGSEKGVAEGLKKNSAYFGSGIDGGGLINASYVTGGAGGLINAPYTTGGDPGASYGGRGRTYTNGYGSVAGVHAGVVNPGAVAPVDASHGLVNRSVFAGVASNPALVARLASMVQGEVGLRSNVHTQRAILEEAFNRWYVRGQSAGADLYHGRGGYYASDTFRRVTPAEVERFKKYVLGPVLGGSNDAMGMTGNASNDRRHNNWVAMHQFMRGTKGYWIDLRTGKPVALPPGYAGGRAEGMFMEGPFRRQLPMMHGGPHWDANDIWSSLGGGAVPPPKTGGDVHIHNHITLDGKTVAKNTMKHIVKHGQNTPHGTRMPDYQGTRPQPGPVIQI